MISMQKSDDFTAEWPAHLSIAVFIRRVPDGSYLPTPAASTSQLSLPAHGGDVIQHGRAQIHGRVVVPREAVKVAEIPELRQRALMFYRS